MDTQTTTIYFTLIAGLVFLTLLLILFIFALVKYQKLKMKEYKNQAIKEIELIDKDRERISADLHDELGAGLAAIDLLLQQHTSSPQYINRAITQLRKEQSKIREIAHNLMPRVLETHGLTIAIDELIEEIKAAGNINFEKDISIDWTIFPLSKSIHIYRIIREILTNAIKHAGCTQITIIAIKEKHQIILTITDNGKGFNLENEKLKKNFGLQNIKTRVESLGSSIQVKSMEFGGIKYSIKIPINN